MHAKWTPIKEGVDELVRLFKESRGSINAQHRQIFEKVNEYSASKDFTNYLLFILNDNSLEEDIRQVSGLTLKGIIERSFISMEEGAISYFKNNVFKCYLDSRVNIRKTISILVNTFLRIGGIEIWPEVLEILYMNLDNDIAVKMCLETLNIIIEDSGNLIEQIFQEFIPNLTIKLLSYLNNIIQNTQTDNEDHQPLMIIVLTSLYILLENCSTVLNNIVDYISTTLLELINCRNSSVRYRVGRCWLSLINIKNGVLYTNTISNRLFNFFTENLSVESYQMNFTAAEFYLCIVTQDEFLKNQQVMNFLQTNLKSLIPCLLHFTKLTPIDVSGLDVENKTFNGTTPVKKNSHLNMDGDSFEDEFDENGGDSEKYNPNWTLRKCCGKIIDKLSNIFPEDVIDILKPHLGSDMQHSDWKIKERSILILGAVGIGSYEYLKSDLINLIPFLMQQLSDGNKFIRAITCWTLSRFTNYIKQNADEMVFKEYLRELLKRFLDKEPIVQEASCSAFNSLVTSAGNAIVAPYLTDVFKIVTSVFTCYKDSSIVTLYETICLLAENFPDYFKNLEIVGDLLISVLKKWYEILNTSTGNSNNNDNLDHNQFLLRMENIGIFDLLCLILKACGGILENYFNDFFTPVLELLERNHNDKEIISKCLDLISVLCQVFPEEIKRHPLKFKIMTIIFQLIETHNIQNVNEETYLKQFILALIGDICKVDTGLLSNYIEFFLNLLIEHLYIKDKNKHRHSNIILNNISVCNNSCWSIGLIALNYNKMDGFIERIMDRLMKLITRPKLNKSLAQNISVCIGRLSLSCPEGVAKYIQSFVKQFCLSLKTMDNSAEKQEAFNGLCKAIILNPTGIMNNFAFFCDALCHYGNAPETLESLFQNIILSYKSLMRDTWDTYYNSFPDKLKKKMNARFSAINLHRITN